MGLMRSTNVAAVLLMSLSSWGMSVTAYEGLLKERDSGTQKGQTVGLVLNAYYQGIYETALISMETPTKVTFVGVHSACFPTAEVFTVDLLKGLMEGELARMRRDGRKESQLDEHSPVLLAAIGLKRAFPCP